MTDAALRAKIDSLRSIDSRLFNRDFLLTWQQSAAAIQIVLQAADVLQELTRAGASTRVFDRGLGVSIFRDKSTRTRYAFRSGCNLLGLSTEELDESTSQISHGETVRETATMVSFLTETIGIRDDMFLGEGHMFMAEVAQSLEESFAQGVLAHRPAVVNLQSDLDHPTQSLADLRHLANVFGGLDALRGRKIAMSWAYSPSYGKPLSVPQGIVALMPRFGMDVVLAHPPGYELVEESLDLGFLLGAHQQRCRVATRGLELAEPALRFGELGLELLLGRAELRVGFAAQRLDRRERARVGRSAAQADQVGAARQVVERVGREIAVARERGDELLAEEILHLDPEAIAQHVHVGDQHDVGVIGRGQVLRRERGVDRAVFGARLGCPIGERCRERPLEPGGEHVLRAGRREVVQQLTRIGQELETVGRQ